MLIPVKKAVVLSSGGVDSTTAMAIAKAEGCDVYSLTIDYGQRHIQELKAAASVAHALNARDHLVMAVDLRKIGGSALTSDMPVPEARGREVGRDRIPVTYVPARNTIFLSIALAWAEVVGACDIFIGVNAVDYSGYPDCRPEYIDAFERMANLATRAGAEGGMRVKVRTPLMHMSKAEIIREGMRLGVDFGMTHSCYDPGLEGKPCRRCESCAIREKGFREAGLMDPALPRELCRG